MEEKSHVSVGISGIALAWGIITQCLQWAGVISWHWLAIWGPFLLIVAFCLLVFIIALIVGVIAELIYGS